MTLMLRGSKWVADPAPCSYGAYDHLGGDGIDTTIIQPRSHSTGTLGWDHRTATAIFQQFDISTFIGGLQELHGPFENKYPAAKPGLFSVSSSTRILEAGNVARHGLSRLKVASRQSFICSKRLSPSSWLLMYGQIISSSRSKVETKHPQIQKL